ncbi:hypothetical protein KIN20_035211 [Parelaphostrongylus tenuis]|uniref:Lipid-binding serum glycoprotein C-terminal domain-containing protein n=1 Tax=Parelaphostrongylus tenuis TaxID=148309 RepID=A0AAD5RBF7_PARTN|nr:hypothetical protein KIN20_035211 [Parelaphostrongylus tenuis]
MSAYCPLLILLVANANAVGPPPIANLKARINLAAFNFFSKTARHVVDIEVPKIELPVISCDITGGPGHGTVTAYNLKITKFHSPKFNFLLSDDGLSWSSSEGAIKIGGFWKADYTFLIPFYESGWVEALASDIHVNVAARVVAISDRPQIILGDCTADVTHFNIEIGGGVLPWLVNLFQALISMEIKKVIHNQACETARSILVDKFNDFLLSLPLHLPVGRGFYVDYALERNPVYTSSFLEGVATAEVLYGSQSCTPATIDKWSEEGLVPRMVVMWMSESVPNCLLSTAHKGKLLQFTVTKDVPKIAPYLRTSCSLLSLCIGRFFSKLSREYPRQYIDLHFRTFDSPEVIMANGVANASATFAVDFYIHPEKLHQVSLARIILRMSSSVIPQIQENKFVGKLNGSEIEVREDFSHIGEMSKTFLAMFKEVFAMTAHVMMQAILHTGVPIPIFDNITISNSSELRVFKKYIRLDADFEFE